MLITLLKYIYCYNDTVCIKEKEKKKIYKNKYRA